MQKAWSESLGRREREKDSRLARRQKSAEAERQDSAGAPGGDGSLGRQSSSSSRRDRTSAGLGSFDVVRSEEEMNAVLAQLAEQEKKENKVYDDVPLPPMILEPNLSLIPRFHGGGNLIEDSLHYERDLKKRVFWTDREKAIFFERCVTAHRRRPSPPPPRATPARRPSPHPPPLPPPPAS